MPGRRCLRQRPLPTTGLASTGWTPPLSPDRSTGRPTALVVGVTGIAGRALASRLVDHGWGVLGLSRRAASDLPGVEPLQADLTDAAALRGRPCRAPPDARLRHRMGPPGDRGREHPRQRRHGPRRARGRPSRRVGASRRAADRAQALPRPVRGLRPGRRAGHAVPRGRGPPRPTPNFYYAQEDELFAAAARDGFTWSVHRAHTIIGYALGNAMNMGQTLAAQAAICREQGRPFVFPGSQTQWNGVTDMTDAGLLAEQLHWAADRPRPPPTRRSTSPTATSSGGAGCGRGSPRASASAPRGTTPQPRPLEEQMAAAAPVWAALAAREGLREHDLDRVASWWHTDGDLGRDMECLTDLARSRAAGFTGYRSTLACFLELFDRLEADGIVPAPPAR